MVVGVILNGCDAFRGVVAGGVDPGTGEISRRFAAAVIARGYSANPIPPRCRQKLLALMLAGRNLARLLSLRSQPGSDRRLPEVEMRE